MPWRLCCWLVVALAATSVQADTHAALDLNFSHLPNRNILSVDISSTETVLRSGDLSEVALQFDDDEIDLPIRVFLSRSVKIETAFGGRQADGTMPFRRTVKDVTTMGDTSVGDRIQLEESMAGLIGVTFTGTVGRDDRFLFEGIEGGEMSIEQRAELAQAMSGVEAQEQGPSGRINIGEGFTQAIPIQVPVPGLPPVHGSLLSHYELERFDEHQAEFAIRCRFLPDRRHAGYVQATSGRGVGIMIYDRDLNLQRSVKLNWHLQLRLAKDGVALLTDMNTISNSQQYLVQ